jgi:hypothetical protein
VSTVIKWFSRSIATLTVIVVAVMVSGLALNGSSTPKGDPAAIGACQAITQTASEYGTISGLLRAETTTAAAVAYWQEHRGRNNNASALRALPGASQVTVCLFSGQFSTPAGPSDPSGAPKAIPNSLRLLVYGTGQVVVDSAGALSGMSPEMPSHLRT